MPKISELTAATAITDDDYLVLVDAPGGTPATKRITAANAATYFGDNRTVLTPEDSGAVGNAVTITDGAVTASDATFTSASSTFTGRSGQVIVIAGAGSAGATLTTTILSVTNATTIELNTNASTTVTGATATYGTNDTSALNTWLALGSSTTELRATPGASYLHSGVLTMTDETDALVVCEGARFVATAPATSAVKFDNCDNLELRGGLYEVAPPPTSRGTTEDHYGLYFVDCSGLRAYGTHVRNTHAAGTLLLNCSNFEYHDPTNEGCWADGFHMTGGSAYGKVYNPRSVSVQDDGVAVVSYVAADSGTLCHDINVYGARTYYQSTNGRGMTVVGGKNINYYDFEIYGTRQAGLYIACEGTFDTHTVTSCRFVGGVIRNAVRDSAFDHGAVMIYNGESATLVMRDILVEGVTVVDSGYAPTSFAAVRVGNDASGNQGFLDVRLGTTQKPILVTGTYWGSATLYDTTTGVTTNVELGPRTPPNWIIGASTNVNPASINANTHATIGTVTCTGAQVADNVVAVTHDGTNATSAGLMWYGKVTAADTVTCYAMNFTGSAIDVGNGQLNATVSAI